MKQKKESTGERIERIRGERSQAEFGELLGGTSQSAVSAWERDDKDRSPSAAIYFRLAALAQESDDSIFFLQQAGLEPDAVISVANVLLKKGEVNMDAILATAEEKLNDRMADQKQMADEGKVVLVPPFPEGPSAAQSPVLSAPALLVPNKASIYYIVGQSDPLDIVRRGFAPGDFIFFDSCESGSGEILERLVGEELLVRLRRADEHAGPHTLFIGRLGWVTEFRDKGPEHMALFPSDASPLPHWMASPMAKLGASWRGSEAERQRQSQKTEPHELAHYEKARPFWYEYSECQVLGKFIARFTAGTVELWKRQAQKPA